MKTALLSVAKKLSDCGTTDPMYFFTNSGCSRTASEIAQKMTPAFASSALKVVPTDTLSNTASTATRRGSSEPSTPARSICSFNGIPSLA